MVLEKAVAPERRIIGIRARNRIYDYRAKDRMEECAAAASSQTLGVSAGSGGKEREK